MNELDNEIAELLGWQEQRNLFNRLIWYSRGIYIRSSKDWYPSTRMDDAIYATERVKGLRVWRIQDDTWSGSCATAVIGTGSSVVFLGSADIPAEALANAVHKALRAVGHTGLA